MAPILEKEKKPPDKRYLIHTGISSVAKDRRLNPRGRTCKTESTETYLEKKDTTSQTTITLMGRRPRAKGVNLKAVNVTLEGQRPRAPRITHHPGLYTCKKCHQNHHMTATVEFPDDDPSENEEASSLDRARGRDRLPIPNV
ncbi:hypothetical protein JTB14_021600 [Gonioctena quinquepunctata]|nr:hypothetical protein JTB14_021600 [Gonioctena quinquepunctata]